MKERVRKFEIKVGKIYYLSFPNSNGLTRSHIDSIFTNDIGEEIVVLRFWLKRKKRWRYEAIETWVLGIYNKKMQNGSGFEK